MSKTEDTSIVVENGLHEAGWRTCSKEICSLQAILFLNGDYVCTSTCLNSTPVPICHCFQAICCQIQASKSMITFTKKFTRHAERFSSNFQPCNTSAQTVRGWRFYKDNSCYCFSITMVIKHSSTRSAKTGSNISRLCLLNNFIVERVQIVAWQ